MTVRPQDIQQAAEPYLRQGISGFGGGGGNRRTRYRSLDAPPKSRSIQQNKQPPGMNPDGNLFGGGGGNRRTRYRSLDAPPKSRSTNKNPLNPTFGRASADLAVAVGSVALAIAR